MPAQFSPKGYRSCTRSPSRTRAISAAGHRASRFDGPEPPGLASDNMRRPRQLTVTYLAPSGRAHAAARVLQDLANKERAEGNLPEALRLTCVAWLLVKRNPAASKDAEEAFEAVFNEILRHPDAKLRVWGNRLMQLRDRTIRLAAERNHKSVRALREKFNRLMKQGPGQ